ncbi:MAG: glycosyltransferase family 4 protein [Planctomycetota bacterium]
MRIVAVATFAWPDHFGGAERVLGEVSERLVRRGHAVTLITAQLDGTAPREQRDGLRVLRYPVQRDSPPRFYRSVFSGVRAALRDAWAADAELLHLHQPLSALAALAPGTPLRRPSLLSFYAPYHEEYLARFRGGQATGAAPLAARAVSAVLRGGDRYLLRRADRILVLSQFSRGQVGGLLPAALARTTVAFPGVDLERFRPARETAERAACRARFGLPEDGSPLVLSVRRLVPRMGLPDLIEACRRLLADCTKLNAASPPAPRLVIAGTGEQAATLRQLASEAGLGSRTHWLGRVEDADLPALYRAASIFALPTRALEGFGMATAEALASGLPIVATDVGATRELLAGSSGATLVAPNAPAELAAALGPLLKSAALREESGLKARRHAEQLLSWDRHLAAVETQAQAALAAHRDPRP